MPSTADLPARLQTLPRRNAISISHERFDSDVNHLVTALYKPLGISPPNRLEKTLELLARASFTQRTRDQFAVASIVASALALVLAMLWITVHRSDPLESTPTLLVSGLTLALGLLGRNSLRRHRFSIIAIVISVMTLSSTIGLGVWRGLSLPRDPWFEAMQIAQAHVNRPELPVDQIVWSTRAPFTVPLPTVDCDCLTMGDRPSGPTPHPSDTIVSFTNRCKGPVTFALSRSRTVMLASTYPWFAASGRDFAVVTLGPGQVVRVPMGGTFGGAFQPWICQKEAALAAPVP